MGINVLLTAHGRCFSGLVGMEQGDKRRRGRTWNLYVLFRMFQNNGEGGCAEDGFLLRLCRVLSVGCYSGRALFSSGKTTLGLCVLASSGVMRA